MLILGFQKHVNAPYKIHLFNVHLYYGTLSYKNHFVEPVAAMRPAFLLLHVITLILWAMEATFVLSAASVSVQISQRQRFSEGTTTYDMHK